MNEMQVGTADVLKHMATRLREERWLPDISAVLEKLAAQVEEPCVVAVVGRVSAGKSRFINALLGRPLAKVGMTETTATINYFRYGQPGPIRCHWRGAPPTEVNQAFIDSLNGKDFETLRKAAAIDHLEFFVNDPRLHGITLVDTPGTGGVIEEHQNRTVEYINLYNDLRQRHDQETRQIGSQADALVFLIGATARAREQEFLEQFRNLTGVGQTPVLNAVGVLAKADMYEDGSGRRHELAATIARQLKTELNTVVPISAGVHAAIKRLCANNRADLDLLVRSLRQLPKDQLEVLLADEGLYLDESAIPNCVLSVQERRSLYHEMEWGVFKAIARAATQDHASVAEVAVTLEDLAGFGPLLKVLKEHILDRAQILRCHNLIAQAVRAVNEIKYTHLPESRREAKENRGRLDRFLSWLQTTHGDDQQVRSELETFLRQALSGTEGLTNRERLLGEFDAAVSKLSQQLIRYNDDFNAVRVLLDNKEQFSAAELDELSALYGLRGTDLRIRLAGVSATVEYIGGRQQFWRMEAEHNTRRGSARYLVAERADAAYGALLYDITGAEGMREGQSY